jgi:Cu(I)/Ag(I) efflux system membrane fusion protein
MTSTSRLHGIGPPLAAAFATAGLFSVMLWVQHARDAWPFAPHSDAPVIKAAQAAIAPDDAAAAHQRVPVDAAVAGALDIQLETVGKGSLTQTVRAVATVVPDESLISHVHTRVAGWIEQLDVNTTGEMVRAGQPLARIFSQELLSSQTEYLAARKNTAASGITSAVVTSGRTRLMVFGMTPAEIDAIEQAGEPRRLVTVVAPRSGVVVNRGVTVGTSIDPSTPLLTIVDLSRVWVLAEVPEANITSVRIGSSAQLDFPASGRGPFTARVDFVYPVLTERTRTLRVRLAAANPGGALKPGLFGAAIFQSAERQAITVPRDAIVDTGLQQHVFVVTGERFEPRTVTTGAQLADRVEILQGLRPGERIVAAGVFLLDSESRLRATGGAGGGGHGHSTPATRAEKPSHTSTAPLADHTQPPSASHAGHEE